MIVGGTVRVPGDKSITHRALIVAALATGRSRISGALASRDTRATAAALRRLGVAVSRVRAGTDLRIDAPPALRAPAASLDCGNSGTTARLLLGALAPQPFGARLTGDASLRRRPMRRVTQPLQQMGARFDRLDTLPLTIHGGVLSALAWEPAVPSAQVKSALLLAGVAGAVPVRVTETTPTRDHTERLLARLGCTVTSSAGTIRLAPARLAPFTLQVPGDFSSAAFPLGAALLARGGVLRIAGVGLNPTRTALLEVLAAMGASVSVEQHDPVDGEEVGDLVVRPAVLGAVDVPAALTPRLLDEVPLLAILAARASGTTRIRGLAELRVKESDRLGLLHANLRTIGVEAVVEGDDLLIDGTMERLRGRVRTGGDHRLAMAFAVLGAASGGGITVDDEACADVSYPGFAATLAALMRGNAA